jgi:hypothetical protein
VEAYYPTIETTFSKSINHNGVDYECEIIDTSGQVRSNIGVYSATVSSQAFVSG